MDAVDTQEVKMASKVDLVQTVRSYLERLNADGHGLSSAGHDQLIRRVIHLAGEKGEKEDIAPRICRAVARALSPNDPDKWIRAVEHALLGRLRTILARITAR